MFVPSRHDSARKIVAARRKDGDSAEGWGSAEVAGAVAHADAQVFEGVGDEVGDTLG
jgi:hypothetical protein